MPNASGHFLGWTLAEAVRRCVDPDLLAQCAEAKRTRRQAGSPTRFGYYNVTIHGAEAEDDNARTRERRTYKGFLAAHGRVVRELQAHLERKTLVAWGRRETPLAEPRSIPAAAWNALRIVDLHRSTATEMTSAKARVFDIRVFPVLEAPDAVDHLAGKTFVEACKEFVFADPQLLSRRKRAVAIGGRPASFGYQWTPYRAVWPVSYGRHRVWKTAIGFVRSGEKEFKLTRVADLTLEKRFARLIGYLAEGAIVADGIPRKGSNLVPIPRSLWERDGTYIEIENGDLIERSRHAQDHESALSRPIFMGLMLRKPSTHSTAVPIETHELQPKPKPRKGILRVQTSSAAHNECVAWLTQEMRKSPDFRPKPKTDWWKIAQRKWPKRLSRRSFDDAWAKAVRASGAAVWAAAGAPRKSVRKSPR